MAGSYRLIVAEKPSVGKAIHAVVGAKERKNRFYIGNGYIVSWCFGHLVQLLMPNDYGEQWQGRWNFAQLPMLPETWRFKVTDNCQEQFNVLKRRMTDAAVDEIICATDADREGECIFRYVYQMAGCNKPVFRLWVSSLEEAAIADGLKNMKPASVYDNLFAAGFCRAKADWLVGMNGSRLFSIRYRNKLNLGRVQTPTLAMIVKRDFEVKHFVKQKYFTVALDCGTFTADSERIDDETKADSLCARVNGKDAVATKISKDIKTINPPKLFNLTTLQREANKMFGYTANQTLTALQALYEAKLTTYPRTDSQFISDDMAESTLEVANTVFQVFPMFGEKHSISIKRCINNDKVTGHHAILPTAQIAQTDISRLPDEQRNILMLVSAWLILAADAPHRYEATNITVNCEGTDFCATGKAVLETGWKAAEQRVREAMLKDTADEKEDEKTLPHIEQGQVFESVSGSKKLHWTVPPKHYTEDTLLSAMEHAGQDEYDDDSEKKGLGTPATRAAIIEGLINNGYADRQKKNILATAKGVSLIEVVLDEVKSPKLTAEWEMQLQQIEHGKYSAETFMQEITAYVADTCAKYSVADNSISFSAQSFILGKCPHCGKEVKSGKFGFYCAGKCGMNIAKVYGKELTETQLRHLLDGKQVRYTVGGKTTIVLPEAVENDCNGKTYYQWKTQRAEKPSH